MSRRLSLVVVVCLCGVCVCLGAVSTHTMLEFLESSDVRDFWNLATYATDESMTILSRRGVSVWCVCVSGRCIYAHHVGISGI